MSYGPNLPTFSGAPANTSTRSCAGRSPPTSRSSSRSSSTSIVNNTTAKALGLKIPEAFLLRANEVIE